MYLTLEISEYIGNKYVHANMCYLPAVFNISTDHDIDDDLDINLAVRNKLVMIANVSKYRINN